MKKACFFSHVTKESLLYDQCSIIDIQILKDLNFNLSIATNFKEIPLDCDIYYSWWASGSIFPFLVASIVRKPIIVVVGGNEAMFYRDSLSKRPKGYLATNWYKKIATKITLKFSDKILIVSEYMRNDVKRLGAKNPLLVHNAVNTNKFIPNKNFRSEIITIFKLDRDVIELKRGLILLNAIPIVLNKFPQQKFTFIGEVGNGFDEFMEECKKLGIINNVRFINNIPNDEVVHWMQRSKIYIQISDTETFGLAIAEAMSCGIPVVVSNRGAIPEVVGENGIYVNQNDPNDVAIGILKVLEMKDEERKLLGNKLRYRIVNKFSYEKRKLEVKRIIESTYK